MTLSEIKTGMTLENTNTTILVTIISVEKNGFTAKEIGNCQGSWDGQIGAYSLASINSGSWKINK